MSEAEAAATATHAEVKQVVLSEEAKQFVDERILPLVKKAKFPPPQRKNVQGGETNVQGGETNVVGERTTFGYVMQLFSGYGYSVWNEREETREVYKAILEFGFRFVPSSIPFTSITVISNSFRTSKHKDIYNLGNSYTFSFGEFSGGELVIEGDEYQTKYAPIIFNGSQNEHYNKDIIGERFSLIYYVRALKNSTQEEIQRIHDSLLPYVVAIPSYQRSQEIVEKTLSFLKNGGVRAESIYIFVANAEEESIYRNTVPKDLYNEIIIGEKGIVNQRNYISSYFPEGKYIVSVDDDVEKMEELQGKDLEPITNIHKFFMDAHLMLLEKKLYLWGVYHVNNPFYMLDKPPLTTKFKFCVGVVHGYINRKTTDLLLNEQAESKEDFERSILHFKKDGGVLLYNHVSFETTYYAEGGLGLVGDRVERSKIAAEYLKEKYPEFISSIKIHEKKKTYEVNLRRL
jgi:hypothetical protein